MAHKRKVGDNKKLRKLLKETATKYEAGAYYDTEKERIIEYSYEKKWLKKLSNKKVRQKINAKQDNATVKHKKMFDLWWELL